MGSSLWDCAGITVRSRILAVHLEPKQRGDDRSSPLPKHCLLPGRWRCLGQRLMPGCDTAGQCWESQGVHWKQETPAADDGASGTWPVCCLWDCQCPAQNSSLRFTVRAARLSIACGEHTSPACRKGCGSQAGPLPSRLEEGAGGLCSPAPAQHLQPCTLCLLQAPEPLSGAPGGFSLASVRRG